MEEYKRDLKDIKEIMRRSSRFISLSGMSGISTGIIALVGVYVVYVGLFRENDYSGYNPIDPGYHNLMLLLLIAAATIILSVGSALYFTQVKSRKQNEPIWDLQSKRLIINLSIPLVTGGLICLIFLFKGLIGLLAPLTLIFYGLALVNASKYTFREIRHLGIIQIVIGLLAMQFIEYSLLLWALGFGIIQIIYGWIVQVKYK